MRQNKINITIHALEEKKVRKRKELEDSHDNCKAMIKHYQKLTAGIQFKTVIIPGDKQNTQFIIPEGKDEQAVINRYLNSRKYK
jgi:hypothetical protein